MVASPACRPSSARAPRSGGPSADSASTLGRLSFPPLRMYGVVLAGLYAVMAVPLPADDITTSSDDYAATATGAAQEWSGSQWAVLIAC
ncbi:hypothetical protein MB901379_01989 [Mycobacterium basiliense]|uniref:Uncharacterized protein n=1 Tax=Mycobacterium basiliense TaxID=2094119 RepID=A0A447GD37_9MYCO|nr:hypothetical protein MB901379_01989 [Mycobacterium basiliense]